jgi:hypothetical protein
MQNVQTDNLMEGKRVATSVTEWPQPKFCATGAFAVDHFFRDSALVEKHVEIIALNIHADEIQQYEQQGGRFPVVVIVVKYI